MKIDFWFEFASTYSYLSAMRLPAQAAKAGVTVRWRPFLLGPIFAAQDWNTSPFNIYAAKGNYMWRDMARQCDKLGLSLQKPNPFPQNGLLAARVATAAIDGRERVTFIHNIFRTLMSWPPAQARQVCLQVSSTPRRAMPPNLPYAQPPKMLQKKDFSVRPALLWGRSFSGVTTAWSRRWIGPSVMADSTHTQKMMTAGLNLIQQALTIYDADLKLAVCNRRFQEMFDLPDDLVTLGAAFEDTIRYLAARGDYGDVGDLDAFTQSRVDVARAFEPHYMERTRADGRMISVEGSPLPQGGWVTVYTDITRTKRQEALLTARSEELSDQLSGYSEELTATNRQLEATITALEEAKNQLTASEARTRLTTEMMPAHIAHVGPDRRYTYSNRRLSSVMPGSRSEIIGLTVVEAMGHEAYQAIQKQLDEAFTGTPSVFEFTHGPSTRRIRAAFTPDGAEGGVYILSMDITEEAQTRAALQQTRRRELAAQMTSGLAHDFSNLLTIILGMQSKLQRMALPPEAEELIAATLSAARRGGSLLNRIADMTGHREHAPLPTDLPGFLNDLEPLARSTLPAGVSFSVNNHAGPGIYLLDAGMLQDSLLNLILNARDASGPSGAITLDIRTVQETWLEFTVSDTGPGFTDRALSRAIEPFFTTKGDDGSGLGLVMVYDMTQMAGGRVDLENTESGARVSIQLPLRVAENTMRPGMVLLVEDSPDLRLTVRDMLRQTGHSVVEATSVSEALSLLHELPEISALLSDITLEGDQTGIDLVAALPADHCPAFLMTSLPPEDTLHQQALTLAPVLRKPFTAAQLTAFLTQGAIT